MNFWSFGAALIAFLQFSCATALPAQSVGETSFENSGAPAAQAEFARGLAQLHNFEYDDAAAHFRKAQEIDVAFAMAYWGEAMTKNHPVWHQQDREAGREVLKRLGTTPDARVAKAKTDREKLYLQAVEILYGDGAKSDRDQEYIPMMSMWRVFTRCPYWAAPSTGAILRFTCVRPPFLKRSFPVTVRIQVSFTT